MRSQLSILLLTLAATAGPVSAQSTSRPAGPGTGIAAALRNAGTLRVADGTWTRHQSAAQTFGNIEALYRNDASPNYFTVLTDGGSLTDQGRLPGTGSEGDADVYRIDSFDFAYCTDQANPLSLNISIFESYQPCTSPTGMPTGSVAVTGLPAGGTPAALACWLITLDLTGSSQSFSMAADGGDGFDNDPNLDSFGLQVTMTGQGLTGTTGPLRAGDPLNAPFGSGTRAAWGFPAGAGTGLGQEDQFWLDSTINTGCFPGNYPNTPYSGTYMVMRGEPDDGNLLTPFPCPVTPNSTGFPALISATGSASVADGNFVLRMGPVNQLQGGIFYYGPNAIQVPFGNGIRCVGGQTIRLPVVFETGGFIEYEASMELDFFGTAGQTIHVQGWYRDQLGGGLAFNLTDGGRVTILP